MFINQMSEDFIRQNIERRKKEGTHIHTHKVYLPGHHPVPNSMGWKNYPDEEQID